MKFKLQIQIIIKRKKIVLVLTIEYRILKYPFKYSNYRILNSTCELTARTRTNYKERII